MPYNSTKSAALVHSDYKFSGGGYMTSAAMSAIWVGHYQHIRGKMASVGLTVGTSATPAQTVLALVESYYMSSDFILDYAARTGKKVAPQAVHLRTQGSAMLQQYLDNPTALAALSGATLNAAYTFRTSGGFTDATSSLSSVGMENDVTFTRESGW